MHMCVCMFLCMFLTCIYKNLYVVEMRRACGAKVCESDSESNIYIYIYIFAYTHIIVIISYMHMCVCMFLCMSPHLHIQILICIYKQGQELLLNHQKRKNLARRVKHMRKMMEKAEAELEEMIAARAKEQQGTIQPPHPGELANLPHNLSRGEGSVRGADHHRLDRSGIEEFQQRARLPSAGSGEGGAGQHGGSDKQRKGLVNRSCLKSSLERPPSQAQIAVCCLPSFFLLQRVVFWSPAFLFFLSPHRPLHTCTPCNLTRACVCVYVW